MSPSNHHPPDWHADPSLPAGMQRWWDGSRWTEHIRHAPPAVSASPSTSPSVAYEDRCPVAELSPISGAPGQLMREAPAASLRERNSASFVAISVAIAYLVLARATGVVLIGVLPAMIAVRALQRRERLAPLAIAAATAAIVFSLSVLTGR